MTPGSNPAAGRLEQLHKLHKADPQDPFCTYGIALEHSKAEEFDTAIEWLDKTIALDADYFYAYFQKAKAYMEKGDDDQAKAVLETGIQRANAKGDAHAASEMQDLMMDIDY